jgi:transcriptional regulator with PAS, ATPase and Fis domain
MSELSTLHATTDQSTTHTPSDPHTRRRRRDRRAGMHQVLSNMMRVAVSNGDTSYLRGTFEEALRRTLMLRSVTVRDDTARWSAPRGRAIESVAFDVPLIAAKTKGVLEASFSAGSPIGEWDFQVLTQASQVAGLILEVDRLRAQLARAEGLPAARPRREAALPLIGTTAAMQDLRARIERVAATDFTVLLEGESGVGKELVARQIHDLSDRRNGPFVAINCAALVETLLEAELFGIEERTATGVRGRRGKFEHADGGTLFLDEVSDLSLAAQAKVLRAIQEMSVERVGGHGVQRVDIRIIAATNRSLAQMVTERQFRPDLFYRLGGVDLRVPSLRERRADIPQLTAHFLDRHRRQRELQVSAVALQALVDYEWPGNVRELERLIERAVALTRGNTIELDDLPFPVRREYAHVLMPSFRRQERLRVWASRYARLMLERCSGNKRHTARVLGISYHTLNSYLRAEEALEANSDAEHAREESDHERTVAPALLPTSGAASPRPCG